MTVRIGLIGAGGMGRAHVERIETELAGGKIVAVPGLNLEGAKAVAEPPGAKAYGPGADLIADPDVDAVLIATFGKVHAPDVIAAVEAGKYVLSEKPLATTPEDCIAIMEAEQKAGKRTPAQESHFLCTWMADSLKEKGLSRLVMEDL